jgi:hypothetical protein
MQKKTRLRLVNSFFILFCTAACAFSLFLFWKDLNSSTVRSDKKKIASITFKQNIAQRKFSDRVVWERLQNNSPLYDADTIRTASQSSATIHFAGDITVDIDENTMLQILVMKDGSYSINVGGGSLSVDTTSVKSGGEAASVISLKMDDGTKLNLEKGSKVSASSDSSAGQHSFQLEAGHGFVENSDGHQEKMTEGQNVQVLKDGKMERSPVTVTSVSRDLKLLQFEGDSPKEIPLEWTTTPELEDKDVIIETSYDKDFAKIENTYETKGSGSVNVENEGGKLYWRVYSKENKENPVQGKITVQKVNDIKSLAPLDKSTYTVKKEAPKINFAWEGNGWADFYKVDVYSVLDDQVPVKSEEVCEENLVVSDLEEGEYLWKVTPHYAINNAGYGKESEIKSIVIKKAEDVRPPLLISPADNAKLNMIDSSTAVNFMWKGENEGNFTVEVSDSKDFEHLVFKTQTENLRHIENFNSSILPEGSYYWKVSQTLPDEENVKTSEIRSFSVERYIAGENKLLYPPFDYSLEYSKLDDFEFMYKISPDFKGEECTALIEFSTTPDFTSSVSCECEKADNKIKGAAVKELLKAGTYYWRAAVKNVNTGLVENPSETRKITLLKDFAVPVITSPSPSKALIVYLSDTVRINWNAVPGAEYYSVKVYDEEGVEIPQVSSTVKNTSFAAKLNLPKNEGENIYKLASPLSFTVSVQPFARETELSKIRIGRITENTFTVRSPRPAVLTEPYNGQKIDGLAALRSPVTLSWRKGDEVVSSKLVLSRRLSDGSWQTEKIISSPKQSENFMRLKSGLYKYQIIAEGAGGIPLSSKEREFTVTPPANLEKAVLVSPSAGFVMDGAYLRKNRNLNFDWQDVQGATDYLFVLYKRNADGSLLKIFEEKTKKSALKFKNLRMLDLASFEWQVTAFARAKDGFVEQKSSAASGQFKIQFELPRTIQTIDSGTQYGE